MRVLRTGGPQNAGSVTPHQRDALESFFMCMAVCHTVVPETDPDGGPPIYQSESPDEGALTKAARDVGFEFITRHVDHIVVQRVDGSAQPAHLRCVGSSSPPKQCIRKRRLVRHSFSAATISSASTSSTARENAWPLWPVAQTGATSSWSSYYARYASSTNACACFMFCWLQLYCRVPTMSFLTAPSRSQRGLCSKSS